MTQPIPGWYPDPYDHAHVRYWNGEAWTAYTAPSAHEAHAAARATAPRQGRSGLVIAIIVIAVSLPVLLGVLAAVSIPVYLNARADPAQPVPSMTAAAPVGPDADQLAAIADAEAQDVAMTLGDQIRAYKSSHGEYPEAALDGRDVVLFDGAGEFYRLSSSLDIYAYQPGLAVIAYDTSADSFCIGVHAASGAVRLYHYMGDPLEGPREGACPGPQL